MKRHMNWSRSGPKGGPKGGPEDGPEEESWCTWVYLPALCTSFLPCLVHPILHLPGYTLHHAAAADVIHALTAGSARAGVTPWAQDASLSLGEPLLLSSLHRVVSFLRRFSTGKNVRRREESDKDWIEQDDSGLQELRDGIVAECPDSEVPRSRDVAKRHKTPLLLTFINFVDTPVQTHLESPLSPVIDPRDRVHSGSFLAILGRQMPRRAQD